MGAKPELGRGKKEGGHPTPHCAPVIYPPIKGTTSAAGLNLDFNSALLFATDTPWWWLTKRVAAPAGGKYGERGGLKADNDATLAAVAEEGTGAGCQSKPLIPPSPCLLCVRPFVSSLGTFCFLRGGEKRERRNQTSGGQKKLHRPTTDLTRVVGRPPQHIAFLRKRRETNANQGFSLSLSQGAKPSLNSFLSPFHSLDQEKLPRVLAVWYMVPTFRGNARREKGGERKKGKGSQSLFTSSSLSLPPLCMCAQALIFCPELPDLPLRRAFPSSNSYSSPPLFKRLYIGSSSSSSKGDRNRAFYSQ